MLWRTGTASRRVCAARRGAPGEAETVGVDERTMTARQAKVPLAVCALPEGVLPAPPAAQLLPIATLSLRSRMRGLHVDRSMA